MKKYLVPASLALLATLSTTAQADDGVNIQALKACSFIENDFRRLLCYDNIMAGKPIDSMPANVPTNVPANKAGKSQGKGAEASAAAAGNANANAANKGKKDKGDFGLEHKQRNEENGDELVAKVSSIKEAPYGELIITLDNGQRWRQVGTESFRISKNDTVVISRAMFNSFLLKKQGSNKSIRVKRTD
ncbi:hypothetical protein [Pseudoalteromonas sp. T1lg88]|uniref:hypothetical protein n=1 Tax=Pseudoalteromonas sp. T1lg88 TaxID=2077104 RepID=UPI000CF71058|nr:hypothetical protein [Pseudoalteromonas sp. T1lg88]